MWTLFLAFISARVGGCCRHALNLQIPRYAGSAFPYRVPVVNVVGSLWSLDISRFEVIYNNGRACAVC